tara:strand:- start:124 stop:771 length:648 start_codon:yes stop_codon:yes gene_type:complete
MDFSLSGNFFIDVLLLILIQALPIPTAPFLVYLATTRSIYQFGILYFTASNIFVFVMYFLGYISALSSEIKIFQSFNKYKFFERNSVLRKIEALIKRAKIFSSTKLKNISLWEILVLRKLGAPGILVSYGSGVIRASLLKNVIANSLLAILDIIFYWSVLGSGQIILHTLLPNIDLKSYIDQHMMSSITIILIGSYAVLIITKFVYNFISKRKKL